MADLNFYKEVYLGSRIPDSAFPELAQRAREVLERIRQRCSVDGSQEAENMALCAMAEELWDRQKQSVSSASVGNVSVHYYLDDRKAANRALYEKAKIYLRIYRGVG